MQDKEIARLEKMLAGARDEAKQNELAWEHPNEQKNYEVDRLQTQVSHASKMGQSSTRSRRPRVGQAGIDLQA